MYLSNIQNVLWNINFLLSAVNCKLSAFLEHETHLHYHGRCKLLAVSYSHAQTAGDAPEVFDPNCYFPHLGVPGEIDSIVGSYQNQGLGGNLQNIGPEKGGSYGRILMSGLEKADASFDFNNSTFATGHQFDLHNLSDVKEALLPIIHAEKGTWRYGHFRSMKYKDLLTYIGNGAIYWADDNGDYDTSRYTKLTYTGDTDGNGVYYSALNPYSALLSNDTVEDIIFSKNIFNTDTILLLHFRGGEQLFEKGKRANQDSMISIQYYVKDKGRFTSFLGTQADFRGSGRQDLIVADMFNNLLYYRNDPPFSLASFRYEILHDTLLSRYDNPRMDTANVNAFHAYVTTPGIWSFFPKQSGDKSNDLIFTFPGYYGIDTLAYCAIAYRGGPNFGSKRLKLDSFDFHIISPTQKPGYFSGNQDMAWGEGFENCGNLSGKGYSILRIKAPFTFGNPTIEFFYQTGKALDDRADMYYVNQPACFDLDSLIGDGDQILDILMEAGNGYYNNGTGTVQFIHGSNQIPAKLNSQWGAVKVNPASSDFIVSPNPMGRKGIVEFSWNKDENIEVRIYDLLGRPLFSEQQHAQIGEQIISFILPSLPSGAYVMELFGGGGVLNKTILVMQ